MLVKKRGVFLAVEVIAFLVENAHPTGELFFLEVGNEHLADLRAVFSLDRFDRRGVGGVVLIEPGDEDHRGDLVFRAVVKRFFRAYGKGARTAGNDDRAVRRRKSFDHFAFEIKKSGNVQQIELISLIFAVRNR